MCLNTDLANGFYETNVSADEWFVELWIKDENVIFILSIVL